MQANARIVQGLTFVQRSAQAVTGHIVWRQAGLVAGLGHSCAEWRKWLDGQEQLDGGIFVEYQRVRDWQIDQYPRRFRIGDLHDALSGDNGTAQPVICRAKNGNPVMRSTNLDARQLGLHSRKLGSLFLSFAL